VHRYRGLPLHLAPVEILKTPEDVNLSVCRRRQAFDDLRVFPFKERVELYLDLLRNYANSFRVADAGCAAVISHDRWFLDRVATHLLAFEGDSRAVWFDGNYSLYEENCRKRLGIGEDQPHRIKYRRLKR